jgi:putative transposase
LSKKFSVTDSSNYLDSTPLNTESWFEGKTTELKDTIKLKNRYYNALKSFSLEQNEESIEHEKKKRKKEERIKKTIPERCVKVKLFPDKKQKDKLNQILGSTRWIYNQCLEGIKNQGLSITKKDMRDYVVKEDSFLLSKEENAWARKIPYDIRDYAAASLLEAYKSNFQKMKSSPQKKFSITFKSKKKKKDMFTIRPRDIIKNSGFYSFFQNIRVTKTIYKQPLLSSFLITRRQKSESKPKIKDLQNFNHDLKIHMDKNNVYWMIIPTELKEEKKENQLISSLKTISSIDPGNRCFNTVYNTQGYIYELGIGCKKKIFELNEKIDEMQSILSNKNIYHRRRYRLKRYQRKIRSRIFNLVKDLHYKICKFLCSKSSIIILPKFSTKSVCNKEKSILRKTEKRFTYNLSHFKFRQRLNDKVKQYPWVNLIITTEEYTTQTCGRCGELNKSIGSKKIFSCKKCSYVSDRDFNSARSILLKTLDFILSE